MKRVLRNSTIITLLVALIIMVGSMSTFAATRAAKVSKPRIESVKYEGNGKFDIDFYEKVNLKNAKVTVKDTSGNEYKVKIVDRDSDDMDVRIKNYKAGRKYKITIKNVKRRGSSQNFTVTTWNVKIPANAKAVKSAPAVEEVNFDSEDKEVSIDFHGRVQWKNPKVVIKGADGKNLVVRIIERDNDGIEVKVKGMVRGAKYTYTISGVRKKGTSSFTKVSGTFRAYDD